MKKLMVAVLVTGALLCGTVTWAGDYYYGYGYQPHQWNAWQNGRDRRYDHRDIWRDRHQAWQDRRAGNWGAWRAQRADLWRDRRDLHRDRWDRRGWRADRGRYWGKGWAPRRAAWTPRRW
jgi:hypothetical protein